MNTTVPLHGFGGGSVLPNFKVVGGTTEPSNPKENTIWVNTDQKITSWHFGADEPNVYNIQPIASNDPWELGVPHSLRDGDRINFTIPATVPSDFEAIRFCDKYTGKKYCLRWSDGTAISSWDAGTKFSVIITNEVRPIGEWAGDGSAYIVAWGEYYHEEGTVWIKTGTCSQVAFNALKKNSIQVYPVSAKQHVSGAWVDKTAKTYQGGAWSDWLAYLYNAGDECTAVTGGWTTKSLRRNSDHDHADSTPTVTRGDSYIKCSVNDGGAILYCTNKIDLTNYKTLKFTGSLMTANATAGYVAIYVSKAIGTNQTDNVVASYTSPINDSTVGIDVGTLFGEHVIMFGLYVYSGEAYVNMKKLVLEVN